MSNSSIQIHLKPPAEGEENESAVIEFGDGGHETFLPNLAGRLRAEWLGIVTGATLIGILGGLVVWAMWPAETGRSRSVQVNLPKASPSQDLAQPMLFSTPEATPSERPTPTPTTPDTPFPEGDLAAPPPQELLALPNEPAQDQSPSPEKEVSRTLIFDSAGLPDPITKEKNASDKSAASGTISSSGQKSHISQGTLIPAVLETPIDGSSPGGVRALVNIDIASTDGSKVIVPRSSRLIGQYSTDKSGGRQRAYIIWKRLERPDGTSYDLHSGTVQSGKFQEQFNSASVVSTVNGSQGEGKMRVRPGQPVRVVTNKDLTLSK